VANRRRSVLNSGIVSKQSPKPQTHSANGSDGEENCFLLHTHHSNHLRAGAPA
jgi:hypothetical protein